MSRGVRYAANRSDRTRKVNIKGVINDERMPVNYGSALARCIVRRRGSREQGWKTGRRAMALVQGTDVCKPASRPTLGEQRSMSFSLTNLQGHSNVRENARRREAWRKSGQTTGQGQKKGVKYVPKSMHFLQNLSFLGLWLFLLPLQYLV